jgi:hypothetical protein
MTRSRLKHVRYWTQRYLADQSPSAPQYPSFLDGQLVGKPPNVREQMLREPQEWPQCSFKTADGRTCRMLRADLHSELCHFHAQQELRALTKGSAELEPLASAILGDKRDFRTAATVNHAIGKLYELLADARIDTRRAAVLAYLSQLALQSHAGLRREQDAS